jgi:hypothetical protein
MTAHINPSIGPADLARTTTPTTPRTRRETGEGGSTGIWQRYLAWRAERKELKALPILSPDSYNDGQLRLDQHFAPRNIMHRQT